MPVVLKPPAIPGVRLSDAIPAPQSQLVTGVPGFVGFAKRKKPAPEAVAPEGPVLLRRRHEYDANFDRPKDGFPAGFLADAVAAFFDNGGRRCYVAAAEKADAEALERAIDWLTHADDLDLVAVPDAMALQGGEPTYRVQRHAVAHCAERGDRFAILDIRPDVSPLEQQRDAILQGQREPVSAALYYPWLKIGDRLTPPSGVVAAVFASVDARVGVHGAPANQELVGVHDIEPRVDDAVQERLNAAGINCIRAFPGRGIRVWGARTISRDPLWIYVNARRVVLTLRRWIALNLAWVPYEPNGPQLWARIDRELRAHLTRLWRVGALSGDVSDDAFYVKCNSETNSPERREAGEVTTEIGLALNPPAEFVVIRIAQREGSADLLL